MIEITLLWLGINLLVISLFLFHYFKTHIPLYRKLKGGIWYLYTQEYVYDDVTGEVSREVIGWSRVRPRNEIILKIEVN
ncbi:MAG: hypothetical protein ACOC2U_00755 [bacterium]